MSIGKTIRWQRFLGGTNNKGIIVPIDHGLTSGPLMGIEDHTKTAAWINHPGVDGVVVHKGTAALLAKAGLLKDKAVMIHLNGMISLANESGTKRLLTSIEAALRYGADAVSLDMFFDGDTDPANIALIGEIAEKAEAWGLPLLVMIGDALAEMATRESEIFRMRHLIRSITELGAQAVKIKLPRNTEDLNAILKGLSRDVDIFVAGGPKVEDAALYANVRCALQAGAKGLCLGRNVFQREAPYPFLSKLTQIVKGLDHEVERELKRPGHAIVSH